MACVPFECGRMMAVAKEYCSLIEGFAGFARDRAWTGRMTKLLPRLHVAVIALDGPDYHCGSYDFPDDDARCELYMRLHSDMGKDTVFWSVSSSLQTRRTLCDHLADDLTDMYFDLKCGLEIIEHDPQQAMDNWQSSFYWHWGRHLLDAECWLQTVDSGANRLPI